MPTWLSLIGVFVVFAIGLAVLLKPAKNSTPDGNFDTHIYTKPLFKISSLIALAIMATLIILK